MSNLEKAVKDLQDNLVVLAEIERRQSALIRENSERIVATEERIREYQLRTDQNLAEITYKLNGLIGYMDGMKHPPQ